MNMSDNARRSAFRTAVQGGEARGAAAIPVTTTRAQALSGAFRPLTRADNVPDAPSKSKNPEDKDPKDVTEKAKDTESFFEKEEKAKNEIEVEKAAGDGGDFEPMGGNENGWDANADATTPANNSTGAPKTPSGF
jgi:hypothetical protein